MSIVHIAIFVLHFGRNASFISFIGICLRSIYLASLSPAFFIAGSTIGNNSGFRAITF